ERVDFGWVMRWKSALLARAFENFGSRATAAQRASFDSFKMQAGAWLEDACLFLALKVAHNLRAWYEWEPELCARHPSALEQARRELAAEIERQSFLQWQFYQQWLALKAYANARDIHVIGDIPIYVARD